MSRLALVPINSPALAAAPTTPTLRAGDHYFDTTLNALCVYSGSAWITLGSASLTASGTVTASTSFGQASNAGSATTYSKGDHTHGTPSLGSASPVALGTAAAGSSANAAHEDHVHPTTGVALTSGTLAQFAATSSSQLLGVMSDETGTGLLVFATSPTLTTPVITQATAAPTFTTNTYTVQSGDEGKLLLASNGATAGNVKIPTDATFAFATGTQIHVLQTGTGQLTISATTAGTTSVFSAAATAASPKLRAQYAAATLLKTAANTWYVFGDIA